MRAPKSDRAGLRSLNRDHVGKEAVLYFGRKRELKRGDGGSACCRDGFTLVKAGLKRGKIRHVPRRSLDREKLRLSGGTPWGSYLREARPENSQQRRGSRAEL